jgi:hypothetical protein
MARYDGLSSYGNTLDKLLISCHYDQKPCDIANDFTPVSSPFYGQCYAFNFHKRHKLKRPGNRNGLIVELFLGEAEFTPCWVNNRGGLVTISNTNKLPVFPEEGNIFQPGKATSYQLTQMDNSRLPQPHGNCEKVMTVSQKRCLTDCANNRSQKFNAAYCRSLNNTTPACFLSPITVSEYYPECGRQCPAECDQIAYDINLHHACYPALQYANNILMKNEKFLRKFSFVNQSSVTIERVKDSTASLNVFFGTTYVKKYSEVPETDPLTL